MKDIFAKEFYYCVVTNAVPRKDVIEEALKKHKIQGIEWKDVKNFVYAKIQSARKQNK